MVRMYDRFHFRANILKVFFLIACCFFLTTSCHKDTHVEKKHVMADSLLTTAHQNHDYQAILTLTDELAEDKSLSKMRQYYWKGYAYSRMRMTRQAENYWGKALNFDIKTYDDIVCYGMSASRLANMMLLRNDYESTMKVCVSALKTMKEHDYDMNTDYACLQADIASCQLKLGKPKEASANYERAYQRYLQILENDDTISNYASILIGIITTTDNLLFSDDYAEAYKWTDRFAELLERYKSHPEADPSFVDKQWARLNMYRASALEGLGQSQEAAQAYQEAMKTAYAKTGDGKMEAISYLTASSRWTEAANNLQILDYQMSQHNIKLTLDNIQNFLLAKYRANVGCHRNDTALAVGMQICNALDSAITWLRNDNAAELATIYETQEKETRIAQQQADMNRQRTFTTAIVLTLVIVFLAIYIINRRRAALRLKHANTKLWESNEKLKMANERAKESSKMKTNFINQISHEIRTPLNILSGFTQIITTPGMELDDATRADINRQITESTDRITGLVNKMLELSDAGSRSTIERSDQVPVIQIAAEAVEASGVSEASHVDFDMQLSDDVESLIIQTSSTAATRALTLLLDNARKFTRPAEATGKVQTDKKEKVVLRLSAKPDAVVFQIEDTGIGVPPAEAKRIFEEFVQLNEYYDGTGIGLTVARSLARRLGGDITLDTTYTAPGRGARFIMTLPLDKQ